MSSQHFEENPDYNNPVYNSKYGIYSEGCGLNNVLMSWGHDDYMYLVYILGKPIPISTLYMHYNPSTYIETRRKYHYLSKFNIQIVFKILQWSAYPYPVSRWPRRIIVLSLQLVFSSSDTIHFMVQCELTLQQCYFFKIWIWFQSSSYGSQLCCSFT